MSRFDFKPSSDMPRSIKNAFTQLNTVLRGLRRVNRGFLFENTLQVTRTDAGNKTGTDVLTFITNWMKVKLTGNWTPVFAGIQEGGVYLFEIQQGSAGSHTVTFPSGLAWGSAGAPTITATANKTDLILMTASSATAYYGFTILQDA